MSEFITDEHVLNNISDDMIYIREMVEREKNIGFPILKHAHLARIVIVFSYNSIDAYKNFIARKIRQTRDTISWSDFIYKSKLTPIMKKIINGDLFKSNDIDEIYTKVQGLKAMRDFISHGLVDCSARKFEQKIKHITAADILKKPNKFSLDDVEKFIKFYDEMVNLLGMSRALLGPSKK